eukprot:CAMPEP_0118925614 /NCGR_PEP_ID=MMETSP1169-20130426/3480_1 /TAXON_ID=36882 /ORGANISM="Pyramimonas obovata, Strain CCMP722" /LENGTH=70 /DNA_ID=CAMNT_0006866963 /DNA_START=140 /DNA_END=349 /DNA_ORIENTATION=-
MSDEGGMNPPRIMESVVFTMPGEEPTPQKVLTARSNNANTPRAGALSARRKGDPQSDAFVQAKTAAVEAQ